MRKLVYTFTFTCFAHISLFKNLLTKYKFQTISLELIGMPSILSMAISLISSIPVYKHSSLLLLLVKSYKNKKYTKEYI